MSSTIVSCLLERVCRAPEATAVRFVGASDDVELSNRALLEVAMQAAATLATNGVTSGERVILALPTGVDFLGYFYGVIGLGAAAVPVALGGDAESIAQRISDAARAVGARFVVAEVGDPRIDRSGSSSGANLIIVDASQRVAGTPRPLLEPTPDTTALVQMTSGSTGRPKGVVLTHGNLVANVRGFQTALNLGPPDIVGSWLPLYHDMGLIGTVIGPMVANVPLLLSPPSGFTRQPLHWLRTLATHQVTVTAAPQFAYSLLGRLRLPSSFDVDLSALRVMLNGAEPIDAAACEQFEKRFEPFGLRPGVVTPCYGLAEATLAVTMGKPLTVRRTLGGPASSVVHCSSGRPIPGTNVRVKTVKGLGQIQLSGRSVSTAYLEEGRLLEAVNEDGWLPTGDLGSLIDGELFVIGRASDMAICGGRNIHPEEVERHVKQLGLPGLTQVGAVAVYDRHLEAEGIAVVVELRRPLEVAVHHDQIRRSIVKHFGTSPRDVRFVPRGFIPVTTSGKVRRSALRSICGWDAPPHGFDATRTRHS